MADVSVQENQVTAEVPGGLLADVVAAAPTVRASGNRFTELPFRAAFSYFSSGQRFNLATGNQGTHCIAPFGGGVIDQNNQELIVSSLCTSVKTRFAVKRV
jgi:hypothetical protein